jgi:hypothetical protein
MALETKSNQPRENSYVKVSNKLNEYSKIEYMLQLSLGTSTAVITNIETIAKSQVTLPFEKNVNKKRMQVVYSFVDTGELDKNTSINTIVNQGFPIGPEGRIFSTGLLKLEKSGAQSYKVLLCKVAVGKSLCYPTNEDDEEIIKKNMEKGSFDSVYLKQDDYDHNSFYRYEYKVFDSTQILPEYLIDFKFDDTKESNPRVNSIII